MLGMGTFESGDLVSFDLMPPPQYAQALESLAPNINTMLGEQQTPGEDWTTTLARLLTVVTATQQQRQLLQVQIDRARQGLPPLNTSQYGIGVQANVGLSSDAKLFIGLGIAAVLGVMLFGQTRKR